jgi:hypothetical protein
MLTFRASLAGGVGEEDVVEASCEEASDEGGKLAWWADAILDSFISCVPEGRGGVGVLLLSLS